MDNLGMIARVLWGGASTLLVAQHRVLCRVAHRLCKVCRKHLTAVSAAGWGGGGGGDMVVEARAKAKVYS